MELPPNVGIGPLGLLGIGLLVVTGTSSKKGLSSVGAGAGARPPPKPKLGGGAGELPGRDEVAGLGLLKNGSAPNGVAKELPLPPLRGA